MTEPENIFAAELHAWQEVTQGIGPVEVLAAAHGVGLWFGTFPQREAQALIGSAPDWLTALSQTPNPETLSYALSALSLAASDFKDAWARFESLRPLAAPAQALLLADGDPRSRLNPETGTNKYHCRPTPQKDSIGLAACSGNEISEVGLAAAQALRRQLMRAAWQGQLESQLKGHAQEFATLAAQYLGFEPAPGDQGTLTESGTGAIRHVAQRSCGEGQGILYILVGMTETGREVPEAVHGCPQVTVASVDIRDALTGEPLSGDAVVQQIIPLVNAALAQGSRVILQVLEGSKSGRVAPGIEGVRRLLALFPKDLAVVADFCQMRPGVAAKAYWDLGAAVVGTGSKFLGGPVFSGLAWIKQGGEAPVPPVGTVLRWQAALAQSQAYRSLPPGGQVVRLAVFFKIFDQCCAHYPTLIPVPDDNPGHIIALQVMSPEGKIRSLDELKQIHGFLSVDASSLLPPQAGDFEQSILAQRCLMGQPLQIGPIAALRLAINAGQVAALPDHTVVLMQEIDRLLAKIALLNELLSSQELV